MNYRLEAEKKANPEFVKIMLELINKEDLEKRKRKYSPEYCLYYIIIVFTELQKWRRIIIFFFEKNNYSPA
jgi:hypothetical protein